MILQHWIGMFSCPVVTLKQLVRLCVTIAFDIVCCLWCVSLIIASRYLTISFEFFCQPIIALYFQGGIEHNFATFIGLYSVQHHRHYKISVTDQQLCKDCTTTTTTTTYPHLALQSVLSIPVQ